jgi:hypothetical protein
MRDAHRGPSSGTTDSIRELVRMQRRLTLEARTITTTLMSALREAEATQPEMSVDERIAMRRRCCERALVLCQDVRAHAARLSAMQHRVTAHLDARERRRFASGFSEASRGTLRALNLADSAIERGERTIIGPAA